MSLYIRNAMLSGTCDSSAWPPSTTISSTANYCHVCPPHLCSQSTLLPPPPPAVVCILCVLLQSVNRPSCCFAQVEQITTEYRLRALKSHPDKNQGDEEAGTHGWERGWDELSALGGLLCV